MTHRHSWIVDSKGFARCKCGQTKQFPGYTIPQLKVGATGKMRHGEFAYDPGFWHCGMKHER